MKSQNHSIIEYIKLEGTHKDHLSSTLWSLQDFLKLNHMGKSIFQTLLELLTGLVPQPLSRGDFSSDWPLS